MDPVWELVAGNRASRVNAELIGEDALQLQVVDRVAQPANARDLTFVVASAPVIGHALVEFIQRAKLLETALAGSPNAPEEWDSEPWSGNEIAWARLLDALTDLGSVVFLSGDVHYAYSVAADHRRRADGAGARFVQLTSSPTKNLVAMSVTLAQFEEALAEANQLVWLQFDLAEVLPTAQDLRELPADVWQLSQEKWTEAVTDHLARIGAIRADMSTDDWFWEGWTKEALVEALRREQQEEWYELQSAWRPIQELVGQSLLETLDDAAYAFVGDRLLDAPVLQEETLLLLHSLGVDPERLVDLRTTVLRDPRLKDRAADSPELEGRLGLLQARTATLLRERTTVAQHNIGVVRTEDTTLGRFVVHDLHWMPYPDLEQQIDLLSEGAQARGDWIITRHVAGLTRTTPADGAIFGVPL